MYGIGGEYPWRTWHKRCRGQAAGGSGGARDGSCTNGESRRGTDSAQYRPNWTVIISGGGGGWPPLAARSELGCPVQRSRCCSPACYALHHLPLVTTGQFCPSVGAPSGQRRRVWAPVSKWTVCVTRDTLMELGTTRTTSHLIPSTPVWSRPAPPRLALAFLEPLFNSAPHVWLWGRGGAGHGATIRLG